MDIDKLFEHFFVINLKRRTDRLERCLNSLTKHIPEYAPTIFNAIDGNKTGTPSFWLPGKSKLEREGSWGCFASHIRIIEQAINEDWDGVLIFEDDVILADDFKARLKSALKNLPAVYDVLYLGGQNVQIHLKEPAVLNDYWARGFNINRTHAYYIPKHYLKTVYEHLYEFNLTGTAPSQHIDWQLGELCKKPESVFLLLTTPLCYQGGGVSDIGNETALNDFEYRYNQFPKQIGTPTFDLKLCDSAVGYGVLGINEIGYDDLRLVQDPGYTYISAHAPSSIVISTSQKSVVKCYQNKDCDSYVPSLCYIDRKLIGSVKQAGEETKEVTVEPGIHFLNIQTDNPTQSHTIWKLKEA